MVAAATQIIRLPLQYCADATEIRVTVPLTLEREEKEKQNWEVEGEVDPDGFVISIFRTFF